MLTIGLTGQSGAGKGEFSRIFCLYDGVVCIDTDRTAREVVEKGKPCLSELCSYFGCEILDSDGELDRKKLASIAFSDEDKHNKLNEITHRYIMEEIKNWLEQAEKGGARIAIIDAPLLFESGADRLCDITLGILAPFRTRLKRILKRDGIDKKSAKLRLGAQPDDNFFKERCTHIIANNGNLNSLIKKAKAFIEPLLENTP